MVGGALALSAQIGYIYTAAWERYDGRTMSAFGVGVAVLLMDAIGRLVL
jgi:hypothetical protein